MAETTTETELTTAVDVITGWNEKLAMNGVQLSQMVPFCELYAIYKDEEKSNNVGSIDYGKDAIDVVLKEGFNDPKPERVKLVPIFQLLTTQSSQNPKQPYNLISPKGPAGIESITVRYHNIELYSYMINMDISIPSLDLEIVQNNSFRRLITFNSEWIIIYGWSRGSNIAGGFSLKQEGGVQTLDLSNSNKGYFKALRSMLIRFDFEFERTKMVTGKLQFMSRFMNGTTVGNVRRQRDLIKMLLNSKVSGLIPKCPAEIKQYFSVKNSAIKTIQETITEGNAQEVPGYYYLGWILEAIRQSIETEDEGKWWKTTKYVKFLSSRTVNVQNDRLSRDKPVAIQCVNPSDIPIDYGWLNSLLDNSTDSIFSLIPKILQKASETVQSPISCRVHTNGGTAVTVSDLNDMAYDGLQKAKVGAKGNINDAGFLCVVSAENSLIENASFQSQIPKELTYGLDVLINTDNGLKALWSTAEQTYKDEMKQVKNGSKKEEDMSALAKMYVDFGKVMSAQKTQDAQNSELRNFIRSDKVSQADLYLAIIQNNRIPVGFALRNYFTTLQLLLHGTAGMPPFSPVIFRGMLKGIDGNYIIYQSTDHLTVNGASFTTSVDCKLIEPD